MPGGFTGVFARRLNDLCALRVVEAAQQMPIEPGTIYIAKGDADLLVLRRGDRLRRRSRAGLVRAPLASQRHPAGRSAMRRGRRSTA